MNAIKRFLRASVASTLGAALQWYLADPRYAVVAPVIMAIGKLIRDKRPALAKWIPV